jgi:hypothetical protein
MESPQVGNPYSLWTPEHDATLIEMVKAGKGDFEIAAALPHTHLSCRQRRWKLGFHRRKQGEWMPEHDEVLRLRRTQGVSFSEIARELDCGFSRNACIGRAKRIGLVGVAPVREKKSRQRKQYPRKPSQSRNRSLPPEPIPELTYSTEFLGVSLFDLTSGMCRYPKGEGVDTLFCGQPVKPDTSWCPHCSQIVYAQRNNLSEAERERRQHHGQRLGRGLIKRRAA